MQRIEAIAPRIKGRVLDIGHSVGTLHDEVSKRAKSSVGLDIVIKQHSGNAVKGDAECMPVKDRSFDVVLAGELIEHLCHPAEFLKECGRVLKKGGRLIITTPNRDSLVNRLFKSYHAPAHLSLFNRKELESLLGKSGFSTKEFAMFPYTEESSEGSKHKWFFLIRKAIHPFLPKFLQEEMLFITALDGNKT